MKELVKGSFLRRNGSFGGRSKITQTLTSDFFIGQSACLSAATGQSAPILFVVTRSYRMLDVSEGIISF